MAPQYWILIIVAAALAAGIVGFFAGRASAPGERRIREMARERDQARSEAEQVRGEVARHFDESARMFGRLAQDYRAFFEHFAETAQNLGMSEGRARELLHRADPRIVDATGVAPGEDAQAQPESAEIGAGDASETAVTQPRAGADLDEHDPEGPDYGEVGGPVSQASGRHGPAGEDVQSGTDAGEAGDSSADRASEQASADEPKSEAERQRGSRGETG